MNGVVIAVVSLIGYFDRLTMKNILLRVLQSGIHVCLADKLKKILVIQEND